MSIVSEAPRSDRAADSPEALLRRIVWPRAWIALEPDEQRAFRADRDAVLLALWPRIALLFGAAAILWWPLDPLVYASRPDLVDAFTRIRLSLVAINGVALLCARTDFARRHTIGSIQAFIAAESALVGAWVGVLGGLDGQFFSYFSAFPALSLLFFVRPAVRLRALGLMWLAFLGGWLLTDPGGLHHPDLPPTMTFLLFVFGVSFYLGHLGFELFRSNVVLRRRLGAKRDELDTLAAGLESRVAEQTDELRRLARRVESVREAERRTVAHEIHDQLGQTLTAIRYGLSFARSRVHEAPDVADTTLGELEGLAARTGRTVRHLLNLLHPRVLDELGLFRAVGWLIQESTRHADLEVGIDCAGDDGRVPEPVATGAFRILQESVTNALKHAEARRLDISVTIDGDRLRLAVRDDGVGPPSAHLSGGMGLGLVGIRERAQTLGGLARWGAAEGGGFEVTAELPLDITDAPAARGAP